MRQHSNREGWREEAAEFDRQAEKRALAAAVKSRDEHFLEAAQARDEAFATVRKGMRDGTLDVRLAELPAIGKYVELLGGQATNRIDHGQLEQVFAVVLRFIPPEHLAEFDRAVAGVLGPGSQAVDAA